MNRYASRSWVSSEESENAASIQLPFSFVTRASPQTVSERGPPSSPLPSIVTLNRTTPQAGSPVWNSAPLTFHTTVSTRSQGPMRAAIEARKPSRSDHGGGSWGS